MPSPDRPALRLIAVPFHDGLEGVDRGRGPSALLAVAGRSEPIGSLDDGSIEVVDSVDPAAPEAARIARLAAAC